MFRKKWRTYISVVPILLGVNWFLGVARFHWSPFKYVFTIMNLPSSPVFLWFERKPNMWWHGIFGHRFEFLLNDEVGPAVVFIIMVLLQAFLITMLLLQIRKWWSQKYSGSVAIN